MNYFYEGQRFSYSGIDYRVIKGNRCAGDLVLEFYVNGWHRPAIAHTMILAAFKYQVEENNYGPEGEIKVGSGGAYLLDAIKRACFNGWQLEAEVINQQRQRMTNGNQKDLFPNAEDGRGRQRTVGDGRGRQITRSNG